MKISIILSIFILFSLTNLANAQEKNILHYFKLMPSEAFDATADGISTEEIHILAEEMKTDRWALKKISENTITISYFDQKVTLLLKQYHKNPMILVQTENAQVTTLHTWVFHNSKQAFLKKDLLPKVSVNDFFDKNDAFPEPEKYSGNIMLYLNEENKITADLYTWMQADFEKKTKKYEIILEQKENNFVITKKEIIDKTRN